MSTQDILSALPRLSVEERALVAEALNDLRASRDVSGGPPVSRVRAPNLHAGAWEVTEDFDAPLPEKFWLGDEA